MTNLILETDSYKLTHFSQYPEGTEGVYSYLEARTGSDFEEIVFVGLEPILNRLASRVVTMSDVEEACNLCDSHLGPGIFNYEGWKYIATKLSGRLPVRIKAVDEGSVIPVGNVLMTVENTDPSCYWLTNALESLLLHVWYPSTVSSLSRATKVMLAQKLEATGCSLDGLPFMLHDFGFRGATTSDAAAIGGLGHLVNFLGTDTLPALMLAISAYGATPEDAGFSVPATEHSVMTALGKDGEYAQLARLLAANPAGIVSCVADSYNIYDFVDHVAGGGQTTKAILARDGKFVVRPDSCTSQHPTPDLLVVDLLDRLWEGFGGHTNDKFFRELNPKIGLIWGDGIDPQGIEKILNRMALNGYAANNIVFGMGGGLLQKVNRDTCRFAFKSSAQKRDGVWYDVQKRPLDASKASKPGRLRLALRESGEYVTLPENETPAFDLRKDDLLRLRFENGLIYNSPTFEEVRKRASL